MAKLVYANDDPAGLFDLTFEVVDTSTQSESRQVDVRIAIRDISSSDGVFALWELVGGSYQLMPDMPTLSVAGTTGYLFTLSPGFYSLRDSNTSETGQSELIVEHPRVIFVSVDGAN